jgi:sugar-specific transcriptional regulator TrmB
MTQEWILGTLINIGFKQPDAEIYVYLTRNGPKQAKDVANALELNMQHTYDRLKVLQDKGTVNTTNDRPTWFKAIPFATVLDLFLKAKTTEAQHIEQSRDEILSTWQSIIQNETT